MSDADGILKMRLAPIAAALLIASCAAHANATEYSFTILNSAYIQKGVGINDNFGIGQAIPLGINDNGTIVGYISSDANDGLGFIYSSTTGVVSSAPKFVGPRSINNSGVIYGSYSGPDPLASQVGTLGYLSAYVSTIGPIRVPVDVQFYYPGYGGINNLNEVAGPNFFITASGSVIPTNQFYSDVNDGGTLLLRSQGNAINNLGDYVTNGSVVHNGISQSLTLPAALSGNGLFLTGINDLGQVIGYTGSVSFLATPLPVPEPTSFVMVLTGLIGLAGLRRRNTE